MANKMVNTGEVDSTRLSPSDIGIAVALPVGAAVAGAVEVGAWVGRNAKEQAAHVVRSASGLIEWVREDLPATQIGPRRKQTAPQVGMRAVIPLAELSVRERLSRSFGPSIEDAVAGIGHTENSTTRFYEIDNLKRVEGPLTDFGTLTSIPRTAVWPVYSVADEPPIGRNRNSGEHVL